jgi:cysteine dioxygenase
VQATTRLEELIDLLPQSDGSEFIGLLKNLKVKSSDFADFTFWSDEGYTRNCISRSSRYELVLLCWEPGQSTSIHCHNGQDCWVYTLEGELEEKRFNWKNDCREDLRETDSKKLVTDSVAYMHDILGFHSLHNTSSKRALTLHLYSEPIENCRVYDSKRKKFDRTDLNYTSLEGQLV